MNGFATFSEIRDDEEFLSPVCAALLDEETGEAISVFYDPETGACEVISSTSER